MEISTEFTGIDLVDKRRDDRARSLLESLAAHPQASINSSCDGWDETKAGCRLFDNPNVDPDAIPINAKRNSWS